MDAFKLKVMLKVLLDNSTVLSAETLNTYAKYHTDTYRKGTLRYSNAIKHLIRKARRLDEVPDEVSILIIVISDKGKSINMGDGRHIGYYDNLALLQYAHRSFNLRRGLPT